jgi:transposase
MLRIVLWENQWSRINKPLQGKAGDRRRSVVNNRLLVEAGPKIAHRGSPRRDLPAEFGRWISPYLRFAC